MWRNRHQEPGVGLGKAQGMLSAVKDEQVTGRVPNYRLPEHRKFLNVVPTLQCYPEYVVNPVGPELGAERGRTHEGFNWRSELARAGEQQIKTRPCAGSAGRTHTLPHLLLMACLAICCYLDLKRINQIEVGQKRDHRRCVHDDGDPRASARDSLVSMREI